MSARMTISYDEYCNMLVPVPDLIWQCKADGASREQWGLRRNGDELSFGGMSDLWQMLYTLHEICEDAGVNCGLADAGDLLFLYAVMQSNDSQKGKVNVEIISRTDGTALKLGPLIRKH